MILVAVIAVLGLCTATLMGQIEAAEAEIYRLEDVIERTVLEYPDEVQYMYIEDYGTYDYYVRLVKQAAIDAGCDYKLAVAVSRLETGNFKSAAFRKGYNFGGIGSNGPRKYGSEEEGLAAYIKLISGYDKKYGNDIDAMAKRYCPGNNEKWARAVKNIMREVK